MQSGKDLIELKQKDYVKGVVEKSNYEFDLLKFEEFKEQLGRNLREDDSGNIILYFKDENGKFQEFIYHKPLPSEEEKDGMIFRKCVHIEEKITLTDNGLEKLIDLSQRCEYSKNLNDLVEPLIQIKRYDSAVRDSSILLETSIKKFHETDSFGQELIEFHINDIVKHNDNFFSAAIKCPTASL